MRDARWVTTHPASRISHPGLTDPKCLLSFRRSMTYAIFSIGSQQFRAEPGLTLKLPKLEAEPGSKVTFDRVLLASDGKELQAGKPVVKGARVTAEVVRHGKGAKIRIYRFARRTGYRRHAGHRQPFTEVRIADVKLG
jgi:large subunit ribosomal protein L21